MNRRTQLRVFENRLLRKIFQPKRKEVIKDGRKLHNKKLHDLYFLLNIIWVEKKHQVGWACGPNEGKQKCIQDFCGEI